MLAHCDMVYAAEGTYLWTPFSRIAVVPEFCSSVLFPKIMGHGPAMEMLLSARKLRVEKAKTTGLVADVFPRA